MHSCGQLSRRYSAGKLGDFWSRYVAGVEAIDFDAYFKKVGLNLTKGWQPGTAYANSRTDKPGRWGSDFGRLRPRVTGW
jgi:hypothetical protein